MEGSGRPKNIGKFSREKKPYEYDAMQIIGTLLKLTYAKNLLL
jgi:hypothetical protein